MRAGLLLCFLACCAHVTAPARPETGFLNRKVAVGGATYRYQVFVPEGWTAAETWPVILFLHGVGERGTDGLLQTQVGIATAVRATPARFPAIIVMPQCQPGAFFTQPEMEVLALATLDEAVREWNGDARRLYLTGLSMGGYGSWFIASRHPGKFAALAPICGGVSKRDLTKYTPAAVPFAGGDAPDPFKTVAAAVGKTPVWVFHGAKDQAVPVTESQKMVEALKAAGGNVRYTEYPDAGHDSWTGAYRDPELMRWMLAQRL